MPKSFTIGTLFPHVEKIMFPISFTKLLMVLFFSSALFVSKIASSQVAPVNPPQGGFAIDGGLRSNTPTTPNPPFAANQGDWYPGTGGTGGSVFSSSDVPLNSSTSGHVTDPYNSNQDSIFTTGSKFNDYISALHWFTNSAPDKNDINNGLYHVSRDANNNQWAFIAGDRLSTNGTSYIDFEFLQGTITVNSDGSFSGSGSAGGRTANDMLISMEYTNGGTKPNVFIYQWKLSGGTYSFQPVSLPDINNNAFAETNRSGPELNLPYTAFGTNAQYQQYAFVEAAINITYLLNQTGLACSGLNIKTLWIKTKASASSTAALKDFIKPISVNFHFGTTSITNPGPFCSDDNTAYTLSATPTGGTFTVDGQSATTFTPSTAGTGNHIIGYSYSGCTAQDTFVVNPKATASAGGPYSMCASNASVQVTGTYGGGATGGTWSSSTGGTFSNVTTNTTNKTVTATYTPTASEKSSGSVTLTFSTTGQTSPCNAASNNATLTIKPTPSTPTVNVVNNCDGSSDLTASGYTGSLLWSTGATTASIHVTTSGTYTVTQTVNGCTSAPGSGTAAPKATPPAPTVGVTNNCNGTSTLAASNYTGSLLWSTGETTASIIVSSPGTYTVTQTVNGCTSSQGSGTAAPKTAPASPSVTYNPPACDQLVFSVTINSVTSGATYSILNKNGSAISGVTNPNGSGGSYTAPNTSSFNFGNIPAGSGYQVTVTNNGCPSTPNTCGTTSQPLTTTLPNKLQVDMIQQTTVTAAPNPFNDLIRFTIQPGVSGKGSLELYNILGQKVKTVFEGNVEKGQLQTIEYNVPGAQRVNLIYLFHVGNQEVSGKLIGIK